MAANIVLDIPLDVPLAITMRWLHIVCAIIAIGSPFFVRFALIPAAAKTLDPDSHQKLRDAINARWRIIVYCVITLFLISGAYQFFVPVRVNGILISARWRDFSDADKKLYHMIFGLKMLGAFAIFFLASALAGRTATFAPIRQKAKLFLSILLAIGAAVLICAILMRNLPW